MATGESLTREDCERLSQYGIPIIGVNDAYRMAPDLEVLYGADGYWWAAHHDSIPPAAECWSCFDHTPESQDKCKRFGLHALKIVNSAGFSKHPGRLHNLGNSGSQAIGLALLMGATTIYLLGFDMQGSHFFGEHPKDVARNEGGGYRVTPSNYKNWRARLSVASNTLGAVKVVNLTRSTALGAFPVEDIDILFPAMD